MNFSQEIIFSIVALIAILLIIFIIIIANLFKKSGKQGKRSKKNLNIIYLIDNGKAVSIAQMNDYLLRENGKIKDLEKIVNYYLDNFRLPAKGVGDGIPNEAVPHMQFISLISRHPNTSAKLISRLNSSLKKKYSGYEREIEEFESSGLKNRRS